MFGTLPAPCRCQIGDQTSVYRGAFCGLCNALAREYGQPARFLINRDSTFVALLAAAQAPDAPLVTRSTRCQPWSRPVPVMALGAAPAFAAAVTLCGLQAKLDDERVDERSLRGAGGRALAALSHSRFSRAQGVLAASNFPVADVRQGLAGQSLAESRVAAGAEPEMAAQPTACAFGSILAHTARLAGNGANVEPLYEAGRNLGRLVYTLDAYQDLSDDCSRGRFNFLVAQTPPGQPHAAEAIRTRARAIATECLANLRQVWQEVELARYRPVLEAVVVSGLATKTQRLLASPEDSEYDDSWDDQGQEQGAQHAACCGSNGDYSGCCYCCDCCGSDSEGGCCACDNGDCGCCDCGGSDCNCCDCGGGDCGGCDCNC